MRATLKIMMALMVMAAFTGSSSMAMNWLVSSASAAENAKDSNNADEKGFVPFGGYCIGRKDGTPCDCEADGKNCKGKCANNVCAHDK